MYQNFKMSRDITKNYYSNKNNIYFNKVNK